MTRFMGMSLQIHSNSELGLQQSMRGAMSAPAITLSPPAAIRHHAAPLHPHGHRVQPGARRSHGRELPLPGGHVELSGAPGHGRTLDPERLERYRWTEERARAYREQEQAVKANYLLDRPRRRTMSGWPKPPGPERFDRQAYPYDLTQMLGGEQSQDVDVELNT